VQTPPKFLIVDQIQCRETKLTERLRKSDVRAVVDDYNVCTGQSDHQTVMLLVRREMEVENLCYDMHRVKEMCGVFGGLVCVMRVSVMCDGTCECMMRVLRELGL